MSIAEKLTIIAENQRDVYNAGFTAGQAQGGGGDDSAFWDLYQENGNRRDYQNAFSGRGWTEETFTPKYDIIVSNAYMLFRYCGIKDLGEALRKAGVRLVIQQNQMQLSFNNTLLEVIDGVEFATTFTSLNSCFNSSSKLREIRVPIPVSEITDMNGFNYMNELREVSFSGAIGKSLNLQWSKKLSHDSIVNIIETLSGTVSGQTLTFAKDAVISAFGGIDAVEWTSLKNTKTNWTITLV